MDTKELSMQEIIDRIHSLELYFEEGRKKATQLRKDLVHVYAPAPNGGNDVAAKVNRFLIQRKARLARKSKKG